MSVNEPMSVNESLSVNEPLMRAVVDRIIVDPDSLNMTQWIKETECGTVACVAGHAMLEAGLSTQSAYMDERAQKALGLNRNQAERIFYGMYFCHVVGRISSGYEENIRLHDSCIGAHTLGTPRQVIENISLVTGLEFKIPDHII